MIELLRAMEKVSNDCAKVFEEHGNDKMATVDSVEAMCYLSIARMLEDKQAFEDTWNIYMN